MTSRSLASRLLVVVVAVDIQACGEENSIELSELPSPLPEAAADPEDAGYRTEAMALGVDDTPVLIVRDGEVVVAFARGGILQVPDLPTFPELNISTGCQPPKVTMAFAHSDRQSARDVINAAGLC